MLELIDCVIRQGTFALRADFAIDAGTKLAVIGPSGAGKSTLLSGIAGFVEAEGIVRWNGAVMSDRPDQRPVSMLFQDHNLFPHLSVAQNVGLGLRPSLKLTAVEAAQIEKALGRVGLEGLGERRPYELSGGQQSRAALARVLAMARPVILLDEPFSAIGPAQRHEMLELVRAVADDIGACLIMVTHDPDEARALAGFVTFVSDGVASAPCEAETFFADPPKAFQTYSGR